MDVSQKGLCLVICVPAHDHIELVFHDAIRRLLVPGRVNPLTGEKWPGRTIVMHKYDHPIREARTALAQEALTCVPDADYILWIDADMQFNPFALQRLIKTAVEHDLDIVGGLCFNRRHPYAPTLFRRHHPSLKRPGFGLVYDYPKGELVEVDATGAAFLLIKPSVYLKIHETDPNGWYMPLEEEMSEDLAFCIRAKKAGYKVFVDTGCHIGHLGKVVIDEAFAERNRQFELAAWVDVEKSPQIDYSDLTPRASIIIPTYNQKPEYLKAAIFSAAYQTVPVEVIVVDDGSDDQSGIEQIVASVPRSHVKLIRHETNRGISAALNTGIAAMTTDWFCWLSSDDLLDSRKVQYQLAAAKGLAKALFTRFEVDRGFAMSPELPPWTTMHEQRLVLLRYCAIFGSTIMVHKSVIDDVGTFDESFKYGQDYEWFLRVGMKYFWHGIPSIMTVRREDENLTAQIDADPEKIALRDAEDDRIRALYALENDKSTPWPPG